MDKINIRISTEIKVITINYTMTIHYDELDAETFLLFIWKDNNIVGNICCIPQYEYEFEIFSNNETIYLNSYNELKEYLTENLVK